MNALVTLRDAALGRNHADEDVDTEDKSLLRQAVDTAFLPLRIATSRPAIKVYLTTILLMTASVALISVSTTAYFFFYYNFIPQVGLTQTVYLQYGSGAHPHATLQLDSSALISQQPYDIYISLHMPRTPSNLASGNFMLDLSLLQLPPAAPGPLQYLGNATNDPANTPLARSRRPAIIPFNSYLTSLAHKLLRLPMHLLSLQDLDSSELKITMFERLAFQRGRSNIPTTAYLEIQSQTSPSDCPPPSQSAIGVHLFSSPVLTTHTALQIYSAQLHFHARFEGLRYYVYNYRIVSFLIFTSLFYTSAILTTAITWALISTLMSTRNAKPDLTPSRLKKEPEDRSPTIKTEAEDDDNKLPSIQNAAEDDSDLDEQGLAGLSSTERTFPTLGRRSQPLRYTPSSTTAPSDEAESSWLVQRDDQTHDAEDEDEDDDDEAVRGGILAGALDEVKDEDEEDTFRGDSGIGTSMESEVASGSAGLIRRRSSRGSGRGGR